MNPEPSDTIAAIATAPGEAGIAVIRVSGAGSLAIADSVFISREKSPAAAGGGGTFLHGHVMGRDRGERADEAICLIFRAPRSYTGEDVVELQCHGGRFAAERVLKAVLAAGARVAEPGEFTRRAFLNGRIDLLQAEAVLDLIRARSDLAASMAVRQLDGTLTYWTESVWNDLISTLADLEANLDFPDEDVPPVDGADVARRLGDCAESLREMLRTWDEGRLLREGALVVIAGQPNAGKSTLMNRLLRHDRSIVSETPGTTRDVVEDTVFIGGVAVRIADTAGLRETDCNVEKEGIRRARNAMKGADIVLYVVDGSVGPASADADHVRQAGIERTVVVMNKSDLGVRYSAEWLTGVQNVACSAKTGDGIDSVKAAIDSRVGAHSGGGHPVMISGRHKEILVGVLSHVVKAGDILRGQTTEGYVLAASELHSAVDLLGTMTGKNYTEELLDSIFSRFCIGK